MVVVIDGSKWEGGGQILRTALSLSAITGEELRIYNIRAKRPRPGLRPQHLTAVKAVQAITDAKVRGDRLGSPSIMFRPNKIKSGSFVFNIGTAGSVSLLAQTLLPLCLFAPEPCTFKFIGGTDVLWAPSSAFMRYVFIPFLSYFGYKPQFFLLNRGYFPKGGGRIKIIAQPLDQIAPIHMDSSSKIDYFAGIAYTDGYPCEVSRSLAAGARQTLLARNFPDVHIDLDCIPMSDTKGGGITLWAVTQFGPTISESALLEPRTEADAIGLRAAEELISQVNTRAPLGKYLSDQILLYMALADGSSKIFVTELTAHTLANIHTIEQFLPVKFNIEGKEGMPAHISVTGHTIRA